MATGAEIVSPAVEAASPLNGVVPPPEHRWKPGQSGNPGGSRTAGAYAAEWMNALRECSRDDLREIARDKSAPSLKVAAARQLLQASGTKVTRTGMPISGPALDRIMDRTEGKPAQALQLTGANGGTIQFNLTNLTDEQLEQLEQLTAIAAAGPAKP